MKEVLLMRVTRTREMVKIPATLQSRYPMKGTAALRTTETIPAARWALATPTFSAIQLYPTNMYKK